MGHSPLRQHLQQRAVNATAEAHNHQVSVTSASSEASMEALLGQRHTSDFIYTTPAGARAVGAAAGEVAHSGVQ